MKRILTLLLCNAFLPVTSVAKVLHRIDNPEYVPFNEGTLTLVSVETTEHSTTLTFCYPGEGSGGFSAECYLIDEAGKRYPLIGHKGFSVVDSSYLKAGREGTYRLEFEPLSADTHVFDFIEDFFRPNTTSLYGIREAGAPMMISHAMESVGTDSFPDHDFKPGNVWIHGCIADYDTARYRFTDVEQLSLGGELTRDSSPKSKIGSDGHFMLPLKVYGPTWTHLNLHSSKSRFGYLVPVMLYPGDHIELRISDIDKAEWDIKYTSRIGKDFNNLMHCISSMCLKMIIGGNFQEIKKDSIRYAEWTPELINRRFDSYDALAAYLAGKYALSNVEAAMLRGELTNFLARDILIATNNYLGSRYPIHKDREEWIKQESPYYNCLSRVYAESNAYLAIPSWQHLLASFIRSAMPCLQNAREQYIQSRPSNLFELPADKLKAELDEMQLQVIRTYRQPKDDDVIFEQAVRFNLLSDVLNYVITHNEWKAGRLTEIHDMYNYQRSLLTHSPYAHMANDVIATLEERHCHQEVTDFIEQYQRELAANQHRTYRKMKYRTVLFVVCLLAVTIIIALVVEQRRKRYYLHLLQELQCNQAKIYKMYESIEAMRDNGAPAREQVLVLYRSNLSKSIELFSKEEWGARLRSLSTKRSKDIPPFTIREREQLTEALERNFTTVITNLRDEAKNKNCKLSTEDTYLCLLLASGCSTGVIRECMAVSADNVVNQRKKRLFHKLPEDITPIFFGMSIPVNIPK